MTLWFAFVAYCAFGAVFGPAFQQTVASFGSATLKVSDVLLIAAGLLGMGPLLRQAGLAVSSRTRTVSRSVLVYLSYEALVVLPIALASGAAPPFSVLREIGPRFLWLMFPVMVKVCTDERAERVASAAVVAAAVCLAVGGVFMAATGNGGVYAEVVGGTRLRVLNSEAILVFAWPLALSLSGTCSRRWSSALLGLAVLGSLLTNHRAGYLAFAVAGVFCLSISGRLVSALRWAFPVVVFLVALVLTFGPWLRVRYAYVLANMLNPADPNAAARLARYSAAWAYFVSHPFGDILWTWQYYLPNAIFNRPWSPHMFLLTVAKDEGLPGLLFFVAVLLPTLRAASGWVRYDARIRALAGYLVAMIVSSLFQGGYGDPVVLPLIAAAVAALVVRADRLHAAVCVQC